MNVHMLRTTRLLGAAGALVAALALGGCSNSSDAARIAELEQEVEQLKSEQGKGTSNAGASSGAAAEGSGAASAEALAADLTAAYPELADFEARVAELEVTCEGVEAASSRDENYQTFLDVKYELDQLEHEMDAYDDEKEYAAQSGDLPYEDYMAIERAIDRLDDRLDYAKDGMELKLGIDD